MIATWFKQVGFLGTLVQLAEKRYARRASLQALDVYWQVRAAHPELTGPALYTEVVIARSRTDPLAARLIVQKADQSFAEWPIQRDLIFRDVVDYLVIDEFIRSHPGRLGTSASMRRVTAKTIPPDL